MCLDALADCQDSPAPAQPVLAERAYFRATVGSLAPLAMATYFWVIWRLYLDPLNSANDLVFGRPGAGAIYYSWFIIATLGLSISQYGLESVEGSMACRPAQSGVGVVRVGEHIDHTWASPDGWLRMARRIILRDERPIKWPLRLWTLLAVVTALGFVGLPLSGLAMDFATGYYPSQEHPSVVGFDNSSWNLRFKKETWDGAYSKWNRAAPVSIPGSGVVYSSPDVDRSSVAHLTTLPNALPENGSVSNFFLAPQAKVPIDGQSWGLAFGFECSVVNKGSNFTILSHRDQNVSFGRRKGYYSQYTVLGGNAIVRVFNLSEHADKYAANIQAVAEIGYHVAGHEKTDEVAASQCYNPIPLAGDKNFTRYPGLHQPQILEMALWQNLSTSISLKNPPIFDLSLADTIPWLAGAYEASRADSNVSTPMSAIGVRCTSVSAVGTASLDGRLATFTDFRRSDSTYRNSTSNFECVERLSLGVPNFMFYNVVTERDPKGWMTDFYSSIGKFMQSFVEKSGNKTNIQSSYLQAFELQLSLARAYSLYALELMYNSGVGYVDGSGTYVLSNFTNSNATEYTAATVLIPGVIPPVLVAVLLTLWGAGSLILSLAHGFRLSRSTPRVSADTTRTVQ